MTNTVKCEIYKLVELLSAERLKKINVILPIKQTAKLLLTVVFQHTFLLLCGDRVE